MKFISKIDILRKTPYLFLFFFVFIISCAPVTKVDNDNEDLVFDLSNKTFNDFNVYNIEGNWDFYWDTLLSPQQLKNTDIDPISVKVPERWTKYKINGKNLPSQGYATYHTKIIVPQKEFYSIKFKRIFLACNIFINDSLVLSIGNVAKSKATYTSSRLTKEFAFYTDKDTIDLVIQVANFSHKKAGIMRPLKFGTPRSIVQFAYTNLLYDVFIIGALAFMMLFYIVLFFYQKKNKSNLFFAIFLLTEIISISLDRELVFFRVISGVNWEIATKLFYVSLFFRTLMFVILIESFTKKYFSKIVKKISIILAVTLSLFIIATPMRIYSETLILMIAFSLVTLFYELYVTLKVSLDDKDLFLSFIGLLFILISAINDALFEYGVIKTFYASGLGVFLFTLSQAILISIKNARVLRKDEILSKREEIESNLKKALLTTPSYELPASLNAIIETVEVEKIVLFTVENDEYTAYLKVEKNIPDHYLQEVVHWGKQSEKYDVLMLKKAIDTQNDLVLSNKINNIESNNLIILPIIEQNKIVFVLYIENKSVYLTDIQVQILLGLRSQFNSLINTALSYYLLQEMNTVLEDGVKERTLEVNKQKEELDFKNQQLDEKVQLLEEQYAIQNEINSELQVQLEKLDLQSESLEKQTAEMHEQKDKIFKQNKVIESNIKYAKTIFSILNVNDKQENLSTSNFFYLDIPKDILSGDFLFTKKNEDKLKDGLDLGLCVYNMDTKILEFAGAYNSLYLIRNKELLTFKGNRMPIGSYVEGFEFPFTKQQVQIQPDDILYLNSDGFVDQFSSENLQKYYTSNFKKLILSICNLPLSEQKQTLYDEFFKWKGLHYQLDDVSVFGVKF